jgi:ATP-dependent DNA helicase PIF1
MCGDFFQLPPVAKHDGPAYAFAFESKAWPTLFSEANMLSLTRVFRQKEDTFVKVLEGMRKGRATADAMRLLGGCNRVVKYDDGIEPVSL